MSELGIMRPDKPAEQITPLQRMLAIRLVQECAELQKALTNLMMFGDCPFQGGVQYENFVDCRNEYHDINKAWDAFFREMICPS